MDVRGKIKIVSGIDSLYAIITMIIGILVLIMGISWVDLMSFSTSYPYGYNPFTWMNLAPWIFLFLGLSTIVYGIKKLVDDILQIMIINQEQKKKQSFRRIPPEQPTQQRYQQPPQQL